MKQVIELVQPTTAESSAHAGFAGSSSITLCMEGLQDLAPPSPAESVKEVP